LKPGCSLIRLTGWLLDVYPDAAGMALWLVDERGARRRLTDPFHPTFYVAEPPAPLRAALKALHRRGALLALCSTERHELGASAATLVHEATVRQPAQFAPLIRRLLDDYPEAAFYHVDVPLPQRYCYERNLFPLARCEAEATVDGMVQTIRALDAPWDTDYVLPPLRVMELTLDAASPNPNHGGPAHLIVRVDGDERHLDGDDPAELLAGLDTRLHRHDPDILLTDWGDSYILPRLEHLARRLARPLALNRDSARSIARRPPRSFFSYGRVLAHAGARTLYGRLHLDRHNSFILAEAGLAGLVEQCRVTKVPLQQMARATTGTGITAMQLETAHRDGLLIPYRKQRPEDFKSALELVQTDQGGLVFAPIVGYHEQVGELDFASMYPTIMTRFNLSPETVNCACCGDDPAARVPEIAHHACQRRDGLVPRTLRPLLEKRAQYKRRLKAAADPLTRRLLDQRQTALKWLLVVSFGYLGYKNARFGRIEAHECVTAHSREILLQAKDTAEAAGFRFLHAIVDSLWLQKPGAERADYEALAATIARRTGLPIAVEGLYRWIGFLPSRTDPRMPVPNQFVGLFDGDKMKIRGLEVRRHDTPPLVRRLQTNILAEMACAATLQELQARIPLMLDVLRTARRALRDGHVDMTDLVIATSLSQEPRRYRRPTRSAIAAQQLLGRGAPLQPGETIHYVLTDTGAACADDRVRAAALLDGTTGYDAAAYDALLLKAVLALLSPFGWDLVRLEAETAIGH
jgi:DNA polymerase-2